MDTRSSSSPGILILSGVRGDTRRYRTLHLYQQLQLAGVNCWLSHITDSHLPQLARDAAVVILHRVSFDPYVESLIETVHARGGLVIVDTDDLIFDPAAFRYIDSPDFQDRVRASLYLEEMGRHLQTLKRCDAIWTSTDYLARVASSLGKPCRVHRNAANLEMLHLSDLACQTRRAPDGKFVLGYASGTPTHNRDFGLISPTLQALLGEHPEFELRIIGYLELDPSWDTYRSQLRRDSALPWRALPGWLFQLDLNLAPLVQDNPFSQSKSEIKYMEAALVGVPTLASPTDAFAYAIHPGQNGLLAGSAEEWRAGIEQMLDPALRQARGKAAYLDVHQNYSPQVRASQAVALLNETCSMLRRPFYWQAGTFPSADLERLWWDDALERHPTLAEMGLYTLRRRGAYTLARQVWIYFRRALAPIFPYHKAGLG